MYKYLRIAIYFVGISCFLYIGPVATVKRKSIIKKIININYSYSYVYGYILCILYSRQFLHTYLAC